MSIGYGASVGLENVLSRLFQEQQEKQRIAEQAQKFAMDQQRMQQDQSQFDQRLGLDKEQFGETKVNNEFNRNKGAADVALRGTEFAQRATENDQDENYRAASFAMQGTQMANQNEQNDLNRRNTITAANLRSSGSQGLSPNQELLAINRLQKQWSDATANANDLRRQADTMRAGLDAARRGDLAAGSQAVLVTFQKILDPTSVVRESEYARSAAGQSAMNQIEGFFERLAKGGAGVPVQELERFAALADQLVQNSGSGLTGRRARLERTAQQYGLDPALIFDDTPQGTSAPGVTPPAATPAPAVRKFNPATGRVE